MFKRQLFLFAIIMIISLTFAAKASSKEYQKPAQMDPEITYKIKTTNDEEFIGKFLDQDAYTMRIITDKRQVITIPQKEILRIYPLESSKTATTQSNPTTPESNYWFENPNACRYFISSSAYNLKKGHSTYQNTYLVINSFNFALSDNFSISTGFELFSIFFFSQTGNFNPVVYVSPKLGFRVNDNFHIGGGVFYANPIKDFFSFDKGISYIYGIGTYGTPNNNLSISLGWGGATMLTLSGQARLSEKFSLVTENWFILNAGINTNELSSTYSYSSVFRNGIYTYGLRFIRKSVTFDLALMNSPELYGESPIGYPYIDFVLTP